MVECWIEEIAHMRLLTDDQEKAFIRIAMKLANCHNRTDIALILQAYYKSMCE